LLLTLSKCQPSVRKEVVQVTHIGIWEASEDILEILEGVYFESLTGLHEAHENRGSMAALQRAGKEPIRSAKNNGFYRTLAGIVGDIDLAGVGVEAECIPALEGVGDSIGELGFRGFFVKVFIEPEFEKSKFWFGQTLADIFALFFSKLIRNALNIKKTFDYAHGEFAIISRACFLGLWSAVESLQYAKTRGILSVQKWCTDYTHRPKPQ